MTIFPCVFLDKKVLKKAGIQEDALRKHKSADDISTPNGVTLLTR